jgi:hypothetical protein
MAVRVGEKKQIVGRGNLRPRFDWNCAVRFLENKSLVAFRSRARCGYDLPCAPVVHTCVSTPYTFHGFWISAGRDPSFWVSPCGRDNVDGIVCGTIAKRAAPSVQSAAAGLRHSFCYQEEPAIKAIVAYIARKPMASSK